MNEISGSITISEVGPRDGLQIVKEQMATTDKVALVDALSEAGLKKIEVTGFAHPAIVPQLSDASEVLASISRRPGTRYAAYAPNVKGAQRAIAAGVDDIKAGLTASQTFNRLNVRMSTEDAVRAFHDIASEARGGGVGLEGVVGTAFGCPYEGAVGIEHVLDLAGQLIEGGASVVYLADTTGMANPALVSRTVEAARQRWPEARIGLHLHNTRGSGLANALAGLEAGIRDFESSIGGLGGCPYAPRAVGNICTEDFVHMLHEMGWQTDTDLDRLIGAAKTAERLLGYTLPGMVMKAGKATELHDSEAKRLKDAS